MPYYQMQSKVCWRMFPAFILRTCAGKRAARHSSTMHKLRSEIERLYAKGSLPVEVAGHARHIFREFHEALTHGEVRAAEKHDGHWRVNAWVKQGILLGFRLGELEEIRQRRFYLCGQRHLSGSPFWRFRPRPRGAGRIRPSVAALTSLPA